MPSADRIYAIDAANVELHCRPEVFGHSFRYLKNHFNRRSELHDLKSCLREYQGKAPELPNLQAKYHVAEEFTDIADGLRAVHEAILFLNLNRGDALSHLFCVGIKAREWYRLKHYRLATRAQDHLDTAVWMLAMMERHGLTGHEGLQGKLKEIFTQQFNAIYCQQGVGSFCPIDPISGIGPAMLHTFTWREYWEAWKLRGDDPYLYKEGVYKPNEGLRYWDRCAVNEFDICKDAPRSIGKYAYLNHLYHFDPLIKKKGHDPVYSQVDDTYVDCVKDLQLLVQQDVADRGIFVETLPTSNVLITHSKRYDQHPILRFYNAELGTKPPNWPQLHVSINTDDAGVFNTTLENEYALMALALTKAKTKKGKRKYSQDAIYKWLERIRQMGNEQAPLI